MPKILLEANNIVCEFADPDFLVLMITPETGKNGLDRLEEAMLSIPRREISLPEPPGFHLPEAVLSIREAALSPCENLPVGRCEGRILAAASVGCPPAVPIVVCGERIDARAMDRFGYYGIEHCTVVIE